MPIPIRLTGPGRGGDASNSPSGSGYFSFAPAQLTDFINLSAPMMKEAAGDIEAGSLFELWKISTVTMDADKIRDRVYDIPKDFNQNELMRLKTSGLLIKLDSGVGFTEKAERIIQTMVLGEENSFQQSSVKKPYSLILAEIKAPKRSTGLTHTASLKTIGAKAEKKDVFRTAGLISLSMSNNIEIPGGDYPDDESTYIFDKRVICREGGSDKEYNVRVYDNEDGTWDVWGWNGRTNGTMKPQAKGRFHSSGRAIDQAMEVIAEKEAKHYRDPIHHNQPRSNQSLPGLRADPNAPKKPVTKKTPVTKPAAPQGKRVTQEELDEMFRKEEDKRNILNDKMREKVRAQEEAEKKRQEEEMAEKIVGEMMKDDD